ncbi:uncharacterized protein V6R79_007075 [Siganus canaliculatus]
MKNSAASVTTASRDRTRPCSSSSSSSSSARRWIRFREKTIVSFSLSAAKQLNNVCFRLLLQFLSSSLQHDAASAQTSDHPQLTENTGTKPQQNLNRTSTELQQNLNRTSTKPQRNLNETSTEPQ